MNEFYQVYKIELDDEMRESVAKQVCKEPKDITENDVRKVICNIFKKPYHTVNGYIALTFDDGFAKYDGKEMMSFLNEKSIPYGRSIFTGSAYQGENNDSYYSLAEYKNWHDTYGTEIFTHATNLNAGYINGVGNSALSSGWLKTWLNTTAYGHYSNTNKSIIDDAMDWNIAVVPYKTGFTTSNLTEEMVNELEADVSYKTFISDSRYRLWNVPTVYLNVANPIDNTSSYTLGSSEYTNSICYNRILADDVTEDFIKSLDGKGAFICLHDSFENNLQSLKNIVSWCEQNNIEIISNEKLVSKLKVK